MLRYHFKRSWIPKDYGSCHSLRVLRVPRILWGKSRLFVPVINVAAVFCISCCLQTNPKGISHTQNMFISAIQRVTTAVLAWKRKSFNVRGYYRSLQTGFFLKTSKQYILQRATDVAIMNLWWTIHTSFWRANTPLCFISCSAMLP